MSSKKMGQRRVKGKRLALQPTVGLKNLETLYFQVLLTYNTKMEASG
jgi:hypothetical protein